MDLETWAAPPGGGPIPNHPRFPVLVYRGVDVTDAPGLFAAHGWGGAWRDGVFSFPHFHSTSHEVLAVVAGSATLELGGPQGEAFAVVAGDVLVLPAGTGHRRREASGDFAVRPGQVGEEQLNLPCDEVCHSRRSAAIGHDFHRRPRLGAEDESRQVADSRRPRGADVELPRLALC